jgi:hypothetical protein
VSGSDSREGWPLLTVETDVNGDSKRTNDRDPSLVGLLHSSCQYNRCQVSSLIFLFKHYYPEILLSKRPGDPVAYISVGSAAYSYVEILKYK